MVTKKPPTPNLKLYAWTATGNPYKTASQIEGKKIYFVGDFDHIAENIRESNEVVLTIAQHETGTDLGLIDATKKYKWFLWCGGCEISGLNSGFHIAGVGVSCKNIHPISAEKVYNILKHRGSVRSEGVSDE